MTASDQKRITILLVVEAQDRASLVRAQLTMLLPRSSIVIADESLTAGENLPDADAAVVDGGDAPRVTTDRLRLLRARGFDGPIVVITETPDDPSLRDPVESLGATGLARSTVEGSPSALGEALTSALGANSHITAELRRARRIFAAGQMALSLQHGINNPLAALLAEAQLLQLEKLSQEQRESVDRMVELCRRIVGLVRQLDALAER
jgi:signal transduction histidine kinase